MQTVPSEVDHVFWNKDLFCLFDSKEKNNLMGLPYDFCAFVLSTSPRRAIVNDFKKPPVPQIFYMPLWSEEELKVIASGFTIDDWKQRFKILGGIPRHVFEVTDTDPRRFLEDGCKQCELNDFIKIIGLESYLTEKSTAIHRLVHMASACPYNSCEVRFASEAALDIIVRNKHLDDKSKMEGLLASCAGNPLAASLCGYIFEPYAVNSLAKGGEFKCRQLVHGNKKAKPAEVEISLPARDKVIVEGVEANQNPNQLHLPRSKNYTAIDAWIPGFGAFQITVGKNHEIKSAAKDDLEKLGENGNKLYWILPPLYYRTFTKKSPQEIDQYAMLIPYPQ